MDSILLVGAGMLAGLVNSVAGGGALIVFPLLISMGVSPKIANTTTSIGVFGGQISSAFGYKKYIKDFDSRLFLLLAIALAGGGIGALLLEKTSNNLFEIIAPWFVIIAVILLILQSKIKKFLNRLTGSSFYKKGSMYILLMLATTIISLYGGFFGAGMGIVIFALISLTGVAKNVNQINGIKNIMTIVINLIANALFIYYDLVNWNQAMLILVGSVFGGYIGSKTASKLPAHVIRSTVIVCGVIAVVILFKK